MAIKFPTKKSAPKIEPKKVIKKKEDIEEVEDTEEEEEEETEEAEEAEAEEDTEEEEEETEEEEEAEEEESAEAEEEEEEEASEEEEEEEEEEKPVKKGKVLAKKVVKPVAKKSAPVKKVLVKKGIKTGSLSSFGQKTPTSKESFPFKIQVGDELLTCDVPGKKPTGENVRLSRDQLISIATFALNKATGKESTKKDVELIFKVFEGVMKQVTDDFPISFMDKIMRRVEVPERAYPALKSDYATLVPAHYEIHFRRVCHDEDLDKIKIKAGKDGKPIQKNGQYIRIK